MTDATDDALELRLTSRDGHAVVVRGHCSTEAVRTLRVAIELCGGATPADAVRASCALRCAAHTMSLPFRDPHLAGATGRRAGLVDVVCEVDFPAGTTVRAATKRLTGVLS